MDWSLVLCGCPVIALTVISSILGFLFGSPEKTNTTSRSWIKPRHLELRDEIEKILANDLTLRLVFALHSVALPRGRGNKIVVRLGDYGGILEHQMGRADGLQNAIHTFSSSEVTEIVRRLDELEAWNLPHDVQPVFDGWICEVAFADRFRAHSIQMHNPEDSRHYALVNYIHSLSPLSR